MKKKQAELLCTRYSVLHRFYRDIRISEFLIEISKFLKKIQNFQKNFQNFQKFSEYVIRIKKIPYYRMCGIVFISFIKTKVQQCWTNISWFIRSFITYHFCISYFLWKYFFNQFCNFFVTISFYLSITDAARIQFFR